MRFVWQRFQGSNTELDKTSINKTVLRPIKINAFLNSLFTLVIDPLLAQLHTNPATTTCSREAARRREVSTRGSYTIA